MRGRLLLLAILVFSAAPVFAVTPTYSVLRAVGTMSVDGSMNEFSWQHAAATANYVKWDGTSSCPQVTTVKAVWDNSFLYLGFQSADGDIFANLTGHDVNTWEQDNAEVFISNPNSATGYTEFEVSPNNAYWDGTFTNVFQGQQGAWNSAGFLYAAAINGTLNNKTDVDTSFTIEMAIPWTDIYQGGAGLPVNGTAIRANFNRINWDTTKVNDTYWGWSATPGPYLSFHRPDSFGTLNFSTANVPEPLTMTLLGLGALVIARRRK